MARSALALSLLLLAPAMAGALASPTASARSEDPTTPQGEDWTLQPRLEPGEGFRVATEGTVDGEPAVVERSFDLDEATLTIRYTLGPEEDPERTVEAHLRIAGVYVFEDDGDGTFDVADRVVDHQRVDPDTEAYVTPVRANHPMSAARAVVALEDRGHVELTLTTSSQFAMLRGAELAATDSRVNLTVRDLAANDDQHAALALEARSSQVSQPEGPLVHLDGEGASVELSSLGAIEPGGSAGASVFEEEGVDDERALVFLASPSQAMSSHEAEANVVHTDAGLANAAQAVQGQPGAFLLGLLAASLLVGATAWRKLRS